MAIHRRLGYLPGEFGLYDRLTGAQTIEYLANLRGGVDPAYQASLVERLDLDPSRRYREYSRGNKQKVALVTAFQHRPDLLILDEPTSGLDPLVQQTFFASSRRPRPRAAPCSCPATSSMRSSGPATGWPSSVTDAWCGWTRSRPCATSPCTGWSCDSTEPADRAAFETLEGVSDIVVEGQRHPDDGRGAHRTGHPAGGASGTISWTW